MRRSPAAAHEWQKFNAQRPDAGNGGRVFAFAGSADRPPPRRRMTAAHAKMKKAKKLVPCRLPVNRLYLQARQNLT
jgi:hypothetical protein